MTVVITSEGNEAAKYQWWGHLLSRAFLPFELMPKHVLTIQN